jgi:transposase
MIGWSSATRPAPPGLHPSDRVKTNRRDAMTQAKLHRADELTAVGVPEESPQAIRDLVRAHAAAVETPGFHKQAVGAVMLEHGAAFVRKKVWSMRSPGINFPRRYAP